ncbi:hypothetical protein L596_017197 [Steinernema carpocapsae]|uniref:Endonuclease III homolog n=1 Tax=Steinernema carpocapsae TaxID=34508 RepID=A0A4U5N1P4_STECR|nr:hypothetical protein L596_017197 [Steinernema carpocapsae]
MAGRRITRRAAAALDQETSNGPTETKRTKKRAEIPEAKVAKEKKKVVKQKKTDPGPSSQVKDIEDTVEKKQEDKMTSRLSERALQQWENIKKMRETGDAPVDVMGCHMLADPLAEPKVFRFQCLLALMLSSQTRDQITAAAMHRLRDNGCNIENILAYPEAELGKMLCPVGMYKKKAQYIQKTAKILQEKYENDIPTSAKEMCDLPGVGPKMAHLLMQIAWDKTEGIGVDTHVHRIVNRLSWIKTSTPEQTRVKLEEILPRNEWAPINKLLVGFGQQQCLPVKPKCLDCLNKDICPASTAKTRKPAKAES